MVKVIQCQDCHLSVQTVNYMNTTQTRIQLTGNYYCPRRGEDPVASLVKPELERRSEGVVKVLDKLCVKSINKASSWRGNSSSGGGSNDNVIWISSSSRSMLTIKGGPGRWRVWACRVHYLNIHTNKLLHAITTLMLNGGEEGREEKKNRWKVCIKRRKKLRAEIPGTTGKIELLRKVTCTVPC